MTRGVRVLLVLGALCAAVPGVRAQDSGAAGTERALEEPEAPPAASDDGERKVFGAPAAPVKPVPPRPEKPRAAARRDKTGKVIVPAPPEPLGDPLRERSGMTGPERARRTSVQALAGAVTGAVAVVCGAFACPALLACSILGNPLFGALGMGLHFLMVLPLHTLAATTGLGLTGYFGDEDLLAVGAAAAAIALVDVVALLVGGAVAAAIFLRWAPAPSQATITVRSPIRLDTGLPLIRGTDWALALNVLTATLAVVFLAPLAGTAAYAVAAWARGGESAEPAVTPSRPAPADKAPRRRRSGVPR
ncbi:MAG: hypothetical protein HY904_25415 [Deltaproteobacteria bacterium]|nr:hypothetical protein [Deltaproteobacteria bacterium]